MEQKHFFTPRFAKAEEIGNAAEQQPQVVGLSSVNKINILADKTLRCSQTQQIVYEMTRHGTISSFVVKTYSMTFDKLKVAYTYYTNKAKPFEVVDWEQFTCCYTKSGGCYYEHTHTNTNILQ